MSSYIGMEFKSDKSLTAFHMPKKNDKISRQSMLSTLLNIGTLTGSFLIFDLKRSTHLDAGFKTS